MDAIISDSWHGHVADTSADKLVTGRDIDNSDKTCLQKLGLANTTQH